jgi:hypothetical protein
LANYVTVSSIPTTNLCVAGTQSSVTTNATTYTWTCSGINGGASDACVADKAGQTVAGACGASNGQNFTTAPSINLCAASTGGVPTAATGSGPFTWTCYGLNAGNASCSANKAMPKWREEAPF